MDDGNIRSYARRLRLGVIAGSALVLLLIIYARLGLRLAGGHVFVQSRTGEIAGPLQPSDGTLVLLGIAIFWLCEALRRIAAGGLFAPAVVRDFRRFALWLLIMALYSFAVPMMMALPGMTARGHHRIFFALDIRDLLLIGITALLFLVARMLERARAIEHEMSEIV
jgi:hypothetical protein